MPTRRRSTRIRRAPTRRRPTRRSSRPVRSDAARRQRAAVATAADTPSIAHVDRERPTPPSAPTTTRRQQVKPGAWPQRPRRRAAAAERRPTPSTEASERRVAKVFTSMDAKQAAKVLEHMADERRSDHSRLRRTASGGVDHGRAAAGTRRDVEQTLHAEAEEIVIRATMTPRTIGAGGPVERSRLAARTTIARRRSSPVMSRRRDARARACSRAQARARRSRRKERRSSTLAKESERDEDAKRPRAPCREQPTRPSDNGRRDGDHRVVNERRHSVDRRARSGVAGQARSRDRARCATRPAQT